MSRHRGFEHEEHPEEGELWLISYADMVTLLLGFFVILYSLSNIDEKKIDELGKQVAKSFGAPELEEDASKKVDVERQLRALRLLAAMLNLGDNAEDIVNKIEKMANDHRSAQAAQKVLQNILEVELDDTAVLAEPLRTVPKNEVNIVLPESMLFDRGSVDLKPVALERLKKLASKLAPIAAVADVEVIGHTDSTLPGPGRPLTTNWAVSSARAGIIAAELLHYGFRPEHMQTSGMADLRPLFDEHRADGTLDPDNMAKNRRVQIVLRVSKGETAAPR